LEYILISSISGLTIEWEKTFGGDEFDWFYCIRQTNDGGYIATGTTEESDMHYGWLLKLDADGDEEWSNVNLDLNGADSETQQIMSDVQQTSDGGYIAGGIGLYYNEAHEYWGVSGYLWKLDSTGETEWLQSIVNAEGQWTLFPFSIEEIDDGFICGGMYVEGTPTNYFMDIALLKTDENGNLEWYKTYDAGGYDMGRSLCFTDDGGYFLAGCTLEPNDNVENGAFYIIKTGSDGIKQWDKLFDGANSEYTAAKGCRQTGDGGYIICGASKSYGAGNNDLWIIKTDISGNMEWDKTFGGTGNDRCYSMDATVDDGYIYCVCKDIGSFSGTKEDIWIIKTDNKGNAEWKLHIEEEGIQHPSSMAQTDDGGFIIAGRTGNMNSKSADGLIVKISSIENQRPDKPDKPEGPANGKPNNEYTFSTNAVTDPDGDTIGYKWDWGDGNFSELLDTAEASYTWTYEDNFEVKVMAIDEHGGESDWSDPLAFSTPRNKILNNLMLERLLSRFPILKFLYS